MVESSSDFTFDPFDFLEAQSDSYVDVATSDNVKDASSNAGTAGTVVLAHSNSEDALEAMTSHSSISGDSLSCPPRPHLSSSTSSNAPLLLHGGSVIDSYNICSSSTLSLFGPPPRAVPVIQNIIASCRLNCTFDLKDIALRAWNTEYEPRKYSAVKLRIRIPRGTALIFQTGKVVVTGLKSPHEARVTAKKVACILKKLGYEVRFDEFKLLNVVSLMDLQYPIQLETLRQCNSSVAQYETEIFPALVYRITRENGQKLACMVFCNGKIVITGCRSLEDTDATAQYITSIVQPHRILSPIPPYVPPSSLFHAPSHNLLTHHHQHHNSTLSSSGRGGGGPGSDLASSSISSSGSTHDERSILSHRSTTHEPRC
jgi:transcription initiation factor TFIID TATA-box-binding protein